MADNKPKKDDKPEEGAAVEAKATDAAEDAPAEQAASGNDENSDADNEGSSDNQGNATAYDEVDDFKEMDPALLSLMVGDLGNPEIIENKCQQILLSLAQVIMVLFRDKYGIKIEASAGGSDQGTRTELLNKIEGDFSYCEASIDTWSDDIAIYCDNGLIISMLECLMGGDDPENLQIITRPLSKLELDLSLAFFEVINEALKATITRNSTLDQSVKKPVQTIPDVEDETYQNYHTAAFSLDLTFGKLETKVTILAPQSKIIKTDIDPITSRKRKSETKTDWAEKLSKQVYNSNVLLQANIHLERMSIGDVGKLQAGDVLRFAEEGDPTVILQANGRDLYNCDLGKSGNRYMVRVEEPSGETDWKNGL